VPAHPSLLELRAKVDSFFQRVQERHGDHLACRRGCDDCCKVDLTVFPVEAEPIRERLRTLPASTIETIGDRVRDDRHCLFLVRGECAVYEDRPIICRTQGLPLQTGDAERTVCPLNFQGEGLLEGLPDDAVLNLNTLNTLLSVLHRVHIGQAGLPDARVRLRELMISLDFPTLQG
jgi:hypothetical protein